jgi:hypothetical protein
MTNPAKGSYVSVTTLANALSRAVASTLMSGPLFARMDEGKLVLFDYDGKQIGVVLPERSS